MEKECDKKIKEFIFVQLYSYFWSTNPLSNLFDELGTGQLMFLFCIYKNGGKMNPSELAKKNKVGKSRIANAARDLEKKGFLNQCVDENDRRKKFFTLTDKATELTKIIDRDVNEYIRVLETRFGKEKIEKICLFIEELTEESENYYKKKGEKSC